MTGTARSVTGVLQHGRLRLYILTLVLATAGLGGLCILRSLDRTLAWEPGPVLFHEAVTGTLIVLGAFFCARMTPGIASTATRWCSSS